MLKTTGIGSLPMHNIDSAIAHSFAYDIPYFPQLPKLRKTEYMIAQALDMLPGLHTDTDGVSFLNVDEWQKEKDDFSKALDQALRDPKDTSFEPRDAVCWSAFCWEITERKTPLAKLQITGPLTSQWALRIQNKAQEQVNIQSYPELGSQILKLVSARSSAMINRLRSKGIATLFFLDEPGLYLLSHKEPQILTALGELKLLILALRKQGASVGLHCCSNTNWNTILSLGLDVVSFDTDLSLDGILKEKSSLMQFLENGGRLSLGVIPTDRDSSLLPVEKRVTTLLDKLESAGIDSTYVLNRSLLTPACGLALKSVEQAEAILADLKEFKELLLKSISSSE
ncbi:MAG: hypothetical protein AB7F43_06060 [Bacteriovoracia bacterium]